MKITVFGTGYVGLVQAAVMAGVGHDVVCVDIDAEKVAQLKRGEIPIFEPGLAALVEEGTEAGRLHFTTDAEHGVHHGGIIFLAVGTPPDEDGSADLKHVLAVADAIAAHMTSDRLVIVKSTVPVGTCEKVRRQVEKGLIQHGKKHLAVDVASNPEFLKEGSAVNDCMKPERIIIGVSGEEAESLLRELYAPFNRNHEKIITMDVKSAELTKYAANCMLATKISFMNEMANLAELLGADIERVRQGIGSDPRIGYHFIYPGLGYGGSCFPKDVKALIRTADEIGYDASVIRSVEERNNRQKGVLVDKILQHYGDNIAGRTFALWGLAFKPNTDDMREAPSRVIMEALWERGANVQAYDPEAMDECQRIYGTREDLLLCSSHEAALEDADALILVTEWKVFQAPDFKLVASKLKQPVIFDGRNIYQPEIMAQHRIQYYGIGRAAIPAASLSSSLQVVA